MTTPSERTTHFIVDEETLHHQKCTNQSSASPMNWHEMDASEHVVQFYETDSFLLDSVSDFIGDGLNTDATCIVIATKTHQQELEKRLYTNGLDLSAAHTQRKYSTHDAATTLSQFLLDGSPDPQRFSRIMGPLITQAAQRQHPIRIFGEMVALLWMQGNQSAAIQLETLWNDLQLTTPPFLLFCAYPLQGFTGEKYAEQLTEIYQQHSHLLPDQHFPATLQTYPHTLQPQKKIVSPQPKTKHDTEENWRELLKRLISDPKRRQQIAEIADIHPITLVRWTTGKSHPQWKNLQPLLNAFPQYHKQFLTSLALEYPHFFPNEPPTQEHPLEIPSMFYQRVLKTYTTIPEQVRVHSLCDLIFHQLIEQLDPQRLGLAVVLFQFIPPAHGQNVRSLRITQGRGTNPWPRPLENQIFLLGAESQAGYAITACHPIIIQNTQEKLRLFPTQSVFSEESAIAIPLLLGHAIVGCLSVSSTQANYFSPSRQDLIQCYADLLLLAFEDDAFYDIDRIQLSIMPPYEYQQPLLSHFQDRVKQCLILATQNQHPLNWSKAETIVWQNIEEELLQLTWPTEKHYLTIPTTLSHNPQEEKK